MVVTYTSSITRQSLDLLQAQSSPASIDKDGVYLAHLTMHARTQPIKGEDRAHIQGYARKWSQNKMLILVVLCVGKYSTPSLLSLDFTRQAS